MEQYKNFASDTLNGAINNSQTTLTVTNPTVFPTTGNFRIIIGSEIMLVTGVSGSIFTVTRGAENTAAVLHVNSSVINHVLTTGSLNALQADSVLTGAYGSLFSPSKAGRLYHSNDAPYLSYDDASTIHTFGPYNNCTYIDGSVFSWVNQGSATYTQTNAGIYLEDPPSSAGGLRIRTIAQPATPYTITAKFYNIRYSNNYSLGGIGFRESATGKLECLYNIRSTIAGIETSYFSSPTANVTRNSFDTTRCVGRINWYQIYNDGTNLTFRYSNDGYYFKDHTTIVKNASMTVGPDEVCFFVQSYNTSYKAGLMLTSWKVN